MGTIFYTAPVAPHVLINAFFLYSFLGWVMECIVIRREKGRWENRGFAHLPFCIIYGFGAMLGFALLRPFSGNYVLLYLVGAVLATLFEYLTARLMLRLFSLTDREKNIILRHMWPLTVTPPKYREAYVIVMFDKYCSLMETFHKPVMELMEYQELTADLKKGFAAQ